MDKEAPSLGAMQTLLRYLIQQTAVSMVMHFRPSKLIKFYPYKATYVHDGAMD
jgi:hypothetical protein